MERKRKGESKQRAFESLVGAHGERDSESSAGARRAALATSLVPTRAYLYFAAPHLDLVARGFFARTLRLRAVRRSSESGVGQLENKLACFFFFFHSMQLFCHRYFSVLVFSQVRIFRKFSV